MSCLKNLPKKIKIKMFSKHWLHCLVNIFHYFVIVKFIPNHIILVWPIPLAQVLPRPQLIFPSKTWFFGIYLNFQCQKSLKNQYLPLSESKSYKINSIKSCSSRSFQYHQRHIPIPPKYPNIQLRFDLIFSGEIIQHSRTFAGQVQTPWNQPMHLSSSRAFERDQEHDLKHPGSVDLISTKQNKTNKLSCFIDRCFYNIFKIFSCKHNQSFRWIVAHVFLWQIFTTLRLFECYSSP